MNKPHTQGPLQVGNFHPKQIFTCEENGPVSVCRVKTTEDARRIVACWNACEGIDTETLEQSGKLFIAFWSKRSFASDDHRVIDLSFVSEDNAYATEDIYAVNLLAVGQCWISDDWGTNHTITRIR